jgi:isochorismate hydrolase
MRRLDRAHSALVLLDVQDRVIRSLKEDIRRVALERMGWLRFVATRCELPYLLTELDPRAHGLTVPQLAGGEELHHVAFSAVDRTDLVARLQKHGREQVVIAGMETHLAVAQTVADLLDAGLQVHLVVDALMDRRPEDAAVAIERMKLQGAVPTTTSAVLYSWVCDAADPMLHELHRGLRQA